MSFHSRRDKSRALDMSNFLAQVMPKFTENFGMTFARKCTYRAPEICRNGNESTFPAKHRSLSNREMNQQPKSGRTTAAQQYRMLTIATQQPHAHVLSSSICMDRALYSVGFGMLTICLSRMRVWCR